MKIVALIGAVLIGFSSLAHSGLIIIEGEFSGTNFSTIFGDPIPVTTLSGSFVAEVEESVLAGGPFSYSVDDLAILTSLTLNPDPSTNPNELGITTFNAANTGLSFNMFDGAILNITIGGLMDGVDTLGPSIDDFFVTNIGGGPPGPRVVYRIGSDPSLSITHTASGLNASGSFTVRDADDPTTDVPAPATLALFGLGLAGLGWSRRKKA